MHVERAIEWRDPAAVEARHHLVARDGPPRRTDEELEDVELDRCEPQHALIAPGVAGAGNESDRAQLEHLRADARCRVDPAEHGAYASE